MSSRACDADDHQQLVTRIHSPTFVVRDNVVVEANDAALALLGATREEIAHVRFDAMFADSHAPDQLRDALAKSSRTAMHAQLRLRSLQGVEQEVSATVTPCDGQTDGSMHFLVTQSMVVGLTSSSAEERYGHVFDSAGDAMLIVEPQTRIILAANGHASALYEVPVDRLSGRKLDEFMGSTLPPVGEFDIARADGTSVCIESSATEIAYRGQTAMLVVQHDISASKKMQSALQQTEQRFDLFMNSVTEYAMMVLDRQGRIESWNSGAERLTGYPAREAVGKPFSIFLSGGASTERQYDAWLLRKDGTSFYGSVLVTPLNNSEGDLIGYVSIVRDSTDRLRLEQEHAALNATLELIAREWVGTFDAIDSAVVLVDEDGAVRRLNRSAQGLANVPFPEILQRRLDDFPCEPWKTAATIARAVSTYGASRSAEAREGDRSWIVEASEAHLESMSQRTVVVIRETTETRKLEESLRQSAMTSALGTMIAGIAHEVRRPLFQLSSTVDACLARLGENSDFQRYAPHLRSGIATMNGIIHELLDYTRSQPLTITPNAPAATVHEAIRQSLSSLSKDVPIHIDAREAPEEAFYDSARVVQMLQNLIENAVQHTPPGGHVDVSVRAAGEEIEFRVEDCGSGFSADDLEKAVQPFYTRRSGGTGLGLAIVKKNADAHGGSLQIANRPQGGGAVTIRLPLQTVRSSEPAPA